MRNKDAFSVLGLFDSAEFLMNAIPEVKAKVTGRLEAYTPYPVHGMDEALGFRKSPVAGMVLVMAFLGAIAALGLQFWTSGLDYPLVTAGKPCFSWEAFIPITFELVVLFATLTAGLGALFLLNRLPFFRHPMLRAKSMPHITRDKFALTVESNGETLDVDQIRAVLQQSGAVAVEVIEKPEPSGLVPTRFFMRVLAAIAISCLVAGYLTYWAMKIFPVSIPMVHMLNQPRQDPQEASTFFKDGFGMRMPVPQTVTRDAIPYTVASENDAALLGNPLSRSEIVLRRGQRAYTTYCSVCHGVLGNGMPTLTAAYGAKPANLVSQSSIELSDGKIYHVITRGKNSMPSYAADLSENERWSAVHYVRVLQRALNARDEDIP
jgi:mono/diheme cytochrome c family protein